MVGNVVNDSLEEMRSVRAWDWRVECQTGDVEVKAIVTWLVVGLGPWLTGL